MRLAIILLLAGLLFGPGCAGPERARQTAKTLAVYTTMVKTNLEDFSRKRTMLIKARLAAVNALEESAVRSETETTLRQRAWRIGGDNDTATVFEDIVSAADFAADQETALALMKAAHAESIGKAKTAANVPSKKLEDTAKGLATLSEKPSLKAQLEFLKKFGEEVKADLDAAAKKADAAAKTAGTNATAKANVQEPTK